MIHKEKKQFHFLLVCLAVTLVTALVLAASLPNNTVKARGDEWMDSFCDVMVNGEHVSTVTPDNYDEDSNRLYFSWDAYSWEEEAGEFQYFYEISLYYPVQWDLNGGRPDDVIPDGYAPEIWDPEELPWGYTPVKFINPVRAGYTFAGWFPAFAPLYGDVTYTAQWTAASASAWEWWDMTCDVYVNNVYQTTVYAVDYDDSVDTIYFSWPGYYWYFNGASGESSFEYFITTTPAVQYFTVTLDLAGGTGTGNYTPQTVEYGKKPVVPVNPTRAGYTFAGWLPALDTPIYANRECVAQWTENPPDPVYYTVTFNLNGGSGTGFGNQSILSGGTVTNPGTPTRTGYIFTGWSPAITTAITAATTFTAQWEAEPVIPTTFTVTFDLDGGTLVAGALNTLTVPTGTVIQMPAAIVTKDGKVFARYYTGENSLIAFDFSAPITENTVIKCAWSTQRAGEAQNIAIYKDGVFVRVLSAKAGSYVHSAEYGQYIGIYDLTVLSFDFTAYGVLFNGAYAQLQTEALLWATADVTYLNFQGTPQPQEPDPGTPTTFTVTFDLDGGTLVAGELNTLTVPTGTVIQMPAAIVTKDGKVFARYYTGENSLIAFDFSAPITKDTVIKCAWSTQRAGEAQNIAVYKDGVFIRTVSAKAGSYVNSTQYGQYIGIYDLSVLFFDPANFASWDYNGANIDLRTETILWATADVTYIDFQGELNPQAFTLTVKNNVNSTTLRIVVDYVTIGDQYKIRIPAYYFDVSYMEYAFANTMIVPGSRFTGQSNFTLETSGTFSYYVFVTGNLSTVECVLQFVQSKASFSNNINGKTHTAAVTYDSKHGVNTVTVALTEKLLVTNATYDKLKAALESGQLLQNGLLFESEYRQLSEAFNKMFNVAADYRVNALSCNGRLAFVTTSGTLGKPVAITGIVFESPDMETDIVVSAEFSDIVVTGRSLTFFESLGEGVNNLFTGVLGAVGDAIPDWLKVVLVALLILVIALLVKKLFSGLKSKKRRR